MKHEKLNDALNEISDRRLAEVLASKKRRPYWIGAVAAVLALVILAASLVHPLIVSVKALDIASQPRDISYPQDADYRTRDDLLAAIAAWQEADTLRKSNLAAGITGLSAFSAKGSAEFLSGSDNNLLWSPVNAYIGLAMLSELTGGNTRQQLLDLLGCKDLTDLRGKVSAIWETAYHKDEAQISTLANSLWLSNGLQYEKDVVDTLAYHHYASSFQGDLGSTEVNEAIGDWLKENTGGLLDTYAEDIQLPSGSAFALYSTLYFQSGWEDKFRATDNTLSVFHAPSGDREVTYLNKITGMDYYRGSTYGAIALDLKNGSRMWLILPDEGLTPEDVLKSGEYSQMILSGQWENRKAVLVNLSVPKFDVSGMQNLRKGLEALGVTDVFSPNAADFTALKIKTPANTKVKAVPVFATAVNQAIRVQVDEEGVKAAAYVEIPVAGSAILPNESIDFILDRPFLFVVTKQEIPLFAGVINEP